jgi:hypothetical protein
MALSIRQQWFLLFYKNLLSNMTDINKSLILEQEKITNQLMISSQQLHHTLHLAQYNNIFFSNLNNHKN